MAVPLPEFVLDYRLDYRSVYRWECLWVAPPVEGAVRGCSRELEGHRLRVSLGAIHAV